MYICKRTGLLVLRVEKAQVLATNYIQQAWVKYVNDDKKQPGAVMSSMRSQML